MKKARLILEDGTEFVGTSIGSEGTTLGEVVFNTGMTGYQEVLTDPSYCGQIVTMTYPLIGNYGVSVNDSESLRPWASGFVVREAADHPSHHQMQMTLDAYLQAHGVIGIEGIDTRMLTRVLRKHGTMRGLITTSDEPVSELLGQLRETAEIRDQVAQVTTNTPYRIPGPGRRVVLLDLGVKMNTVRSLTARGCDLIVMPAYSSREEILAWQPEGLMMSNGPGDPADLFDIVETIRSLLGVIPIFGICMGHQLLSLACGAKTEKLRFGHRGVNHPVRDLRDQRVYITSQNHGYVVAQDSLCDTPLEITHVNQNDGSIEGVMHRELRAFSVQFHPEAKPGPDDSEYLFDDFMKWIDEQRGGAAHA